MPQQTINIGTSLNSGDGDQLRIAFDKTNQNLTELYTNSHVDDDVETVSGTAVDNTDPRNPVINVQDVSSKVDKPSGSTQGFVATVDSTGNDIEYVSIPPAGASDFLTLTDSPTSYAGEAGKLIAVNNAEDGIEFISSSIPTSLEDVHQTVFTGSLTATPVQNYVAIPSLGIGSLNDPSLEGGYLIAEFASAGNRRARFSLPFNGTAIQKSDAGDSNTSALLTRVNSTDNTSLEFSHSHSNNSIPLTLYKIVYYKPQKTVINSNDVVVNDQASSGYIDIGNTRIQWGKDSQLGQGRVVTFPVPFASAPVVTLTADQNSVGIANLDSGPSTTSFSFTIRNISSAAINSTTHWQAIGVKP